VTRFLQFFRGDAISLRIQGKKKPEIIRELVGLLATAGVVRDVETVTAEVIAREELATTGIGGGIAIPHCLSAEVTGTALAFGRRVPGAKFDAVDKQPVQLFFLMVGLPGAHNEHLRYLSKLSRYLHDADTKAGCSPPRVRRRSSRFSDGANGAEGGETWSN
jgi:mannitol/fructose-specific phosphotransferase system IIA component (Ntr-type)